MSICSISQNIINTCMKGLHSHALEITSFHGFVFNIEVVLYQICMRTFLWVWWCGGSHILCKTLYFHSHILFSLKSKKLLCEKLAFSCHCITSFHVWSSFMPDLYEGYCMSWMILWQKYMNFLLFNFMSLFSVGLNPINPYVKLLHSHAIESLVSMTLASILKESCIIF